jgi:DNA topoisomerase-3
MRLELVIAGERFVASGRQTTNAGWRDVLAAGQDAADDDPCNGEAHNADPLPPIAPGEVVIAEQAGVEDKQTRAPKPFTDGALISVMRTIGKFVSDPNLRKVLSEIDGIGTPATRASIIETLFERRYVTRDRSSIVSTETGRALIAALPPVATTPDRTALWELAMRTIAEGRGSLDRFLACVTSELTELVAQGRCVGRIVVPRASPASEPRAASRPRPTARRRRARSSHARA